ncbi:plasmid replication, integration and excision activator [Actinoalloteichus caeruleus]|uniref:plasmid replication, integration and excision activator n=1 Tax=Actinoalloteichus cyanogriseus TaxID=2893586 RepID=UPI003BB982A0
MMGVEPVMKFQSREERARGAAPVPELDPRTEQRQWLVTVIDQAAERKSDAVVTVKISADVAPVPPEALPGTNLRPVVFEGLTVTPWIDSRPCTPPAAGQGHRCRARQQFSYRASGMRAPGGSGSKPVKSPGVAEPGAKAA